MDLLPGLSGIRSGLGMPGLTMGCGVWRKKCRGVIGCLLLIALFAAVASADDAYQWTVTAPDGRVESGSGVEIDWVPLMPGPHVVRLAVTYQHEDPSNPGHPYVATATRTITVTGPDLRGIFADGFETGTAGEWSRTVGGAS